MSAPAFDPEWGRILSDAVKERYEALRVIRDRVHKTCLASLTAMLGLAGWAVQRSEPLDMMHRTLYFVAAAIVVLCLRLIYLRDLERGFRTQQQVAVRSEAELGLYRGIYPLAWKRAGNEGSEGRFFTSTYRLLYV